MLKPLAMSCWDRPTILVALSRNPDRYVRLAQALIDAVPCSWNKISAHLVISSSGRERCEIRAACGATEPADAECRPAVRRAIAELASNALIPDRSAWVGIWIDYDIESGRLVASIMHDSVPAEDPLSSVRSIRRLVDSLHREQPIAA